MTRTLSEKSLTQSGFDFDAEREEWRPVVGCEGRYEVSDKGRIRALFSYGQWKFPRILQGFPNVAGYRLVELRPERNKRVHRRISEIVLETFASHRPEGCDVHYRDGNTSNLRLTNLCWQTTATDSRPHEEWKPIIGLESRYQVSNLGRVRAVYPLSPAVMRIKRVLKTPLDGADRPRIELSDGNGHIRYTGVARLVLEAFVGPCPSGQECLHRDGNPQNNILANIHWGTHSQNMQDRERHGTGNGSRVAIPTAAVVRRALANAETILLRRSNVHFRPIGHPTKLPIRESWRPIRGYETRYEVSSHGRVRAIFPRYRHVHWIGRVLNPSQDGQGYKHLTLVSASGERRRRSVHHLVLDSFLGTRPLGCEALHRDGNPENNSISNLAWGTRKENATDRERHGRTRHGSQVSNSKLSETKALAILLLRSKGYRAFAISRCFGISKTTVKRILSGHAWQHIAGLSP